METKSARKILPSLLVFLGIGALGGGGALVVSPSGELMHMPLSMLAHSPFGSFLIPGIILFLLLGVWPCLVAYALLKKTPSLLAERMNCFRDMHWSWTYAVYCAFTLIFWIQIQQMFLQAAHWLHSFYLLLAVVLIFCALLPSVRRVYKK
ncbi:hypothetical protein [Spirosoma litoris]